ncbi:hypothetical protein CAPTEDRAFT_169438 [Capitella teleta]|uniref:Deoxynucleoside kinase domain-containing protein n=1 Tax=Capitella teleta TaxID=283909 RepID=R7TZV8_CAPTE|nr:hypothetical protein CAPTEDRAFT_169438 [Capitella teleta]|eukprot:ELT96475.1 hypothetical protein CAPTEDRAFT_169438 [Capitella teleta]
MLGGDASCDMAWDDMERLEGLEGLREFCARRTKKFTVSVEGNIGCGKSTLLKYFESCPTVECLKEPVDQWRDIQGHNALQLLYEDPKRWAFSFDNYSMLTRLEMHRHKHAVPVKMLERSLFSTRYVFVENSHKSGMLTDLEFAVLSEWFDFITTTQKVGVDLFVYLKAPPDVCHRRIMARNRKEESGVPLDFIEKLHDLHEDWLINQKKYKVPGPVLVLDASHELPKMKEIYEEFKSEILCGCT